MPSQRPMSTSRARRLARTSHDVRPTSLLPVGHDAALADVGLVPVGEVAGAVALSESESFVSAGAMAGAQNRTWTSNDASRWHGPGNDASTLTAGLRTSKQRMLEEASALGADGVVGVRLDVQVRRETRTWFFETSGTAVRSLGRTRAGTPFSTDLDGTEVASAMRSGWMPLAFVAVPLHAVRSLDRSTFQQLGLRAPNGEIDAWTELVNTARHQARQTFAVAARATGADGAVLSGFDLEFEKGDVARARVLVRGTALVGFRVRTAPSGLTVMPLTPASTTTGGAR